MENIHGGGWGEALKMHLPYPLNSIATRNIFRATASGKSGPLLYQLLTARQLIHLSVPFPLGTVVIWLSLYVCIGDEDGERSHLRHLPDPIVDAGEEN